MSGRRSERKQTDIKDLKAASKLLRIAKDLVADLVDVTKTRKRILSLLKSLTYRLKEHAASTTHLILVLSPACAGWTNLNNV